MPNTVPAIYTPSLAMPANSMAPRSTENANFSFHDLLDIVNPLQHLPVIGTLYRAITGEHIGKFEKVAGDALYGGVWGAVSSVADLAFEAVTGKDFGDTVLSLFTGSGGAKAPVAVAQNSTLPSIDIRPDSPDISALTRSLAQKGFDSDISQRALSAYRRSIDLNDPALAGS